MANKISQRQVVAEIVPVVVTGCPTGPAFSNYFAQVSGGEITAAVEKIYDGGILFPEVLTGPPEIGDVTITRHYDADRDGPALKLLRNKPRLSLWVCLSLKVIRLLVLRPRSL